MLHINILKECEYLCGFCDSLRSLEAICRRSVVKITSQQQSSGRTNSIESLQDASVWNCMLIRHQVINQARTRLFLARRRACLRSRKANADARCGTVTLATLLHRLNPPSHHPPFHQICSKDDSFKVKTRSQQVVTFLVFLYWRCKANSYGLRITCL